MDFSAFSTLSAARQDSISSPKRPTTQNMMDRLPADRVASSVYSRAVDHETSSTYWSAEAPPTLPIEPTPPEPEVRTSPDGTFREEHEQINAMMQDLGLNETDESESPAEAAAGQPIDDNVAASHGPSTPKSNKNQPQRQRDLSDRAFVDALRTDSATAELIKAIVRVSWIDNLQQRLVFVAIIIHRDLRKCFHTPNFTHDTARRAAEIAASIDEVLNIWVDHMLPLQKAIETIDVVKDTPDLMNMTKEEHGPAMKAFAKMLLPIPTEIGAECNSKIIKLMKKLFDDEVRQPFEQLLNSQEGIHSAEVTAQSYLVVLNKNFDRVHFMAEQLHESTNTTWEHWKRMSEHIAQQAEFVRSHTPAALTHRTKTAMSRMFHNGLSRAHTKKCRVPRNDAGRIQISSPIESLRQQPREANIRNTTVDIPAHPLDAAPENVTLEELMNSSAQFPIIGENETHEGDVVGPFTPHTQFSPRSFTTDSGGPSKAQDISPSLAGNGSPKTSDSSFQDNHKDNPEDDPFAHWDSTADNQVNSLEYYHNNPNAPIFYWNPPESQPQGRRPVSSPYEWHLPSGHATESDDRPSSLIDGARYYDMLREFYRMDPDKPDEDEDPELYALWYRAQALRRLEEGGPPADDMDLLEPSPAMLSIQRAYDAKNKKTKKEVSREREQLRQQHARLDDLDAELRIAVAEQRSGQRDAGREKKALRESMSIGGAGYDGQQDPFRTPSNASRSIGVLSRSVSRQEGSSGGSVARKNTKGKRTVRPDQDGVSVFPERQYEEPQATEATPSSLEKNFVFPPTDMQPQERDEDTGPLGHGQMEMQERGNSEQSWYGNEVDLDYYATDEDEPWRLGERSD